jgi:hypothetical protein
MGWKCPECGNQHDDISSACSCGYSVYKILGIKPGASAVEARQAHKYLLTVWQTDRSAHDAASRKKAEERLKKINLAYEILKENLPGAPPEEKKSSSLKMSLSVGAGAIMLLGILAFYTGVFKSEKDIVGPSQGNEATNLPALPAEKENAGQSTTAPANEGPEQPMQSASNNLSATGADMTEEMAIEKVKKSNVLFRNTSTESIIKKWTEDNAGKLQVIGWKAKKMDDEKYLVSYIAMDGAVAKGFYFDFDISTGEVVNLANRPDLQKEYNIHYSQ